MAVSDFMMMIGSFMELDRAALLVFFNKLSSRIIGGYYDTRRLVGFGGVQCTESKK